MDCRGDLGLERCTLAPVSNLYTPKKNAFGHDSQGMPAPGATEGDVEFVFDQHGRRHWAASVSLHGVAFCTSMSAVSLRPLLRS